MCGINGIAGDIGAKDEKSFKDHLLFNTVRGDDSTGIASIPRNKLPNDIKLFKQPGSAYDLMQDKRFDRVFNGTLTCLIGHNRSATVGGLSYRSSHPFYFGNTIGCHNGTITGANAHRLDPKNDYANDSAALIANINELGPLEAFGKLEQTENVAFAVAWYNLEDHSINFARNSKRPLFYVFSKSGKSLYWGSEIELLLGSVRRNLIDCEKAFFMKEDSWIKWKIPTLSIDKFEDPIVTKLKYYEKTVPDSIIVGGKGKSPTTGNFFPAPRTSVALLTGPKKTLTNTQTQEQSHSPTPPVGQASGTQHPVTQTGSKVGENRPGSLIMDSTSPFNMMIPYVNGEYFKILWDTLKKVWVQAHWERRLTYWNITRQRFAPPTLRYEMLDIRSNHIFKHVGKKKNKVIYYRGLRGTKLNKDEFTLLMDNGCSGCGRNPEWGNKVEFMNDHGDFLCQFCVMDKDLLETWKNLTGSKEIELNDSICDIEEDTDDEEDSQTDLIGANVDGAT